LYQKLDTKSNDMDRSIQKNMNALKTRARRDRLTAFYSASDSSSLDTDFRDFDRGMPELTSFGCRTVRRI